MNVRREARGLVYSTVEYGRSRPRGLRRTDLDALEDGGKDYLSAPAEVPVSSIDQALCESADPSASFRVVSVGGEFLFCFDPNKLQEKSGN